MEMSNISVINLFDEIKSCATEQDLEKISDLLEEAYLCNKVSNSEYSYISECLDDRFADLIESYFV